MPIVCRTGCYSRTRCIFILGGHERFDGLEGDYINCMDWTKEGTPYNLQVIPQYIHREYYMQIVLP